MLVAGVYLFVFRRLLDLNAGRDEKKLDDALRVLRVRRGGRSANNTGGKIAGEPEASISIRRPRCPALRLPR